MDFVNRSNEFTINDIHPVIFLSLCLTTLLIVGWLYYPGAFLLVIATPLLLASTFYFFGKACYKLGVQSTSSQEKIKIEQIDTICSLCKCIKENGNDSHNQKNWLRVEDYLLNSCDVTFSHGICPSCLKEHYPDLD